MTQQTLADLFRNARLLEGKRKSFTHYFNDLVVGDVKYYGTLLTKKGGARLQGRDRWKAIVQIMRDNDHVADFHGYGATEREAIDDMEAFVMRWQEKQEEMAR